MHAAALKKSDGEERIELPEIIRPDRPAERARAETRALFLRRADELRKEAAELENEAKGLRADADELVRRANQQPEFIPQGQVKIGDWKDLKIGDALWAYMKQVDFDKRPLTEVADALLKAGVDPGSPSGGRKAKNRTPQKTMIANIKKSAIFRNCKCDDSDIWRVRTP